MLSNYFKGFHEKLVKKSATKKTATKAKTKTAKGKSDKISVDMKELQDKISKIIPSNLVLDVQKPIDTEGFSPDGADFIVYKEFCEDLLKIMDGYVPFELIYGTYHVLPELEKKTLPEILNKVVSIKKLNQFSDAEEDSSDTLTIPAFIIVAESNYSFLELKNDIINFYMSNGIDPHNEFDLMMIPNKGLMIKNWREPRSYIALETNEDTAMYFFILMNEYLQHEREEIDFRNYVKKEVVYTEY